MIIHNLTQLTKQENEYRLLHFVFYIKGDDSLSSSTQN